MGKFAVDFLALTTLIVAILFGFEIFSILGELS